MAERRRVEIVIAEVPKSRADVYRIGVREFREGRLLSVATVHRYRGGEVEVGSPLTIKPGAVDSLVAALLEARDTALGAHATKHLQWLENPK